LTVFRIFFIIPAGIPKSSPATTKTGRFNWAAAAWSIGLLACKPSSVARLVIDMIKEKP